MKRLSLELANGLEIQCTIRGTYYRHNVRYKVRYENAQRRLLVALMDLDDRKIINILADAVKDLDNRLKKLERSLRAISVLLE